MSDALSFEVIAANDPRLATCGLASPTGTMRCEYPPDHKVGGDVADHHTGRDSLGRWRTWQIRPATHIPNQTTTDQGVPA